MQHWNFLPFINNNMKRVFRDLSVPADLWVSWLNPYLLAQRKTLFNHVTNPDASSYDKIKKYLLEQLHLIPHYFIDEFNCTSSKNKAQEFN
jgi:hypothetical protein